MIELILNFVRTLLARFFPQAAKPVFQPIKIQSPAKILPSRVRSRNFISRTDSFTRQR
jgi:hypothetical protein